MDALLKSENVVTPVDVRDGDGRGAEVDHESARKWISPEAPLKSKAFAARAGWKRVQDVERLSAATDAQTLTPTDGPATTQ